MSTDGAERYRRLADYAQALVDYELGLVDDRELSARLVRHGLVVGTDGAWLLDAVAGRWRWYDGVGIDRVHPPEGPGGPVSAARWRLTVARMGGLAGSAPGDDSLRE